MAKTPKTAFNPSIKKEKKAKSIPLNYKDLNACWQIGLFDFNNEKWETGGVKIPHWEIFLFLSQAV